MHILIVDDEPLARNELAYLINQSSKEIIISEADDEESALRIIQNEEIDAVFLDIHLTSENGLDVADKINRLTNSPEIVFATAYDEYAVKAFERDVRDYILKPFTLERVQQTISRLAITTRQSSSPNITKSVPTSNLQRIPLEVGDRIVLINIKDILAIEVQKGDTTIYTKDSQYIDNHPLIKWEERLTGHSFLRVHRSYLIQIEAIKEVQPWFNQTYQITLLNDMKVPVSRSYLKEFREVLGL